MCVPHLNDPRHDHDFAGAQAAGEVLYMPLMALDPATATARMWGRSYGEVWRIGTIQVVLICWDMSSAKLPQSTLPRR